MIKIKTRRRNNWSISLALFLASSSLFWGCSKTSELIPNVNINAVTEVSGATSATVNINFEVLHKGVGTIGNMGVCYAKHPNPILNDLDKQVVQELSGQGNYDLTVDQLEKDSTYYFRAYGVNEVGLQYSTNEIEYKVPNPNGTVSGIPCTPTVNTTTDGGGPELTMNNNYSSTPWNNYSEFWYQASDGTNLKFRINFVNPVLGTYTTAQISSSVNTDYTIKIWKIEQSLAYYTDYGQTVYIEADASGKMSVTFCDLSFTSASKTTLLSGKVLLP